VPTACINILLKYLFFLVGQDILMADSTFSIPTATMQRR
jgi:hypothetical protein